MPWGRLPVYTGNAPCKDCPYRHPTCHSDCADYLEYREKANAKLEELNLEKRIKAQSWEGYHAARDNYIKKNGSLRNPHGGDH